MNSDGTRQLNISNHPAADGMPYWSPNSAKIAFSTDRKGTGEIYVMGRYGGSKTRLTHTAPGVGSEPRGWSPGGARVLYQSGGGIWVVNVDGTNNHRVTNGREAEWSR
jgi:Tol biopolymer transport system component